MPTPPEPLDRPGPVILAFRRWVHSYEDPYETARISCTPGGGLPPATRQARPAASMASCSSKNERTRETLSPSRSNTEPNGVANGVVVSYGVARQRPSTR